MWMGRKPLSLTAYLLELERSIWEQTSNHFWKRKILTLSASSGIYHSVMWDSSTRAEQTPGWIKTDSLISRCAPPLPPFAGHCPVSAGPHTGSVDREPGGAWIRRADRVKRLPLNTANQPRTRGGTGGDSETRRGDCGSILLQCRLAHKRLLHLCPIRMAQ